jgi:histidinol dehydrogenase
MLSIFENPDPSKFEQLCQRPQLNESDLSGTIQAIIDNVKINGDKALFEYSSKFDKVQLKSLVVTNDEIENASSVISEDLKLAIQKAKFNIEKFHSFQKSDSTKIETTPGVFCWRKNIGIEKVGFYIPGGSAPLFSTILMLGVPAKIAGCKEIVLCTPPDLNGNINPAILYTAKLVGITKIIKAGGAQAIAAMAIGTETVPKVYKIFGPGNQYVTKAKQMVNAMGIAIDMPAGPSEVMVVADELMNPAFAAADLISQAEHGADSQVILISNNLSYINKVNLELEKQLSVLDRNEIAKLSLQNSKAFVIVNFENIALMINTYAPEHLIICCNNQFSILENVYNAGSVFIGPYSPESFGDYASGTNHVLPTYGFAKAYSGVSLDSFVKKITFQEVNKDGLINLGSAVEKMAEAEGLTGHKNAVTVRLNSL